MRSSGLWVSGVVLAVAAAVAGGQQVTGGIPVTIETKGPTTPFPHFWETTFGSGRAVLALRDDYRKDLDTVRAETALNSVRAHGILNDEVGLYDPDRKTQNPGQAAVATNDASVYNFTYVDEIYDGLVERHVKPFVELSFMPKKMAADPSITQPFWYRPFVSPPKDYAEWDGMIKALAAHVVARYGLDEVSTWKWEVWNEPNLDFWGGQPKQATYFTLYDHTARDLKSVSERLQVGGPATAQAAWVTPFLAHVSAEHVPVDFVSTHVYANDQAKDVFGTSEEISRDKMVWRSVEKVHEEIGRSPLPKLPLIFSEYNASYANEPNVTDTTYMGPWLANNIRLCDGLTETMALWTFSDVFEEQGVPRTPFYGGFGLMAVYRIPKPVMNAFAALHTLGDRRLKVESDSVLATRRADGETVVAVWNYAAPDGTGPTYTKPGAAGSGGSGPVKHFVLTLKGVGAGAMVKATRVDDDHGNVLKAFDAMGRPDVPTREQIVQLRAAGQAAAPETMRLKDGRLELDVPAHGLVVLEVR